MRIVGQSWRFEPAAPDGDDMLRRIELAARTCYKSKQNGGSLLIRRIIANGHDSVLEHASVSVRIVTDRGVSHELVRHRLASYSQESTRYCNYAQNRFGSEITVVVPAWYSGCFGQDGEVWRMACAEAERAYFRLLTLGWKAEQARTVLPHSLATEIVMTANVREWRHVLRLRTGRGAHPQMVDLMSSILDGFQRAIPILFDDITQGPTSGASNAEVTQ